MSNSTANVVIALASQLLFGLEDNWAGHSEINPSIPNTQSTLVELLEVTSNHSMIDSNWRLQALAYRADYDSLIHARTAWESAVVAEAYSILSTTNSTNAASVLKQALTALQSPNTNPSLPLFLSDMERLMAAINQSIGLTVLQGQAPDLGFPNWNCSLGDTEFLIDAIGYAYGLLPNVSSALAAVRALLDWSTPVPGGYYDNLGDCDPSAHPHLDPGQGSESDPSFYFTPLVAFTGSNDEPAAAASRASWRTFSQILYFSPLR